MREVIRILQSLGGGMLGRLYQDTTKILQLPPPSRQNKDLFCVSSLMLSDCCITQQKPPDTQDPKVCRRLPKLELQVYPAS